MRKGFWASLIIFIITLIFLVIVNSIEIGISFTSQDSPYITQMQKIIDALQKYNEIDGIISIISFATTGIIGLLAKIRGIPLTD